MPLLAAACSAPGADAGVAGAPASLWLGAEVRGYPAGVAPVLVGAVPVSGRDVVTISLGANVTDRQDFGEHDDEEGSGAGLGVGYRRFAGEQLEGWFYGARVDLWALSIDWRDEPGARGTSDVLVLQPSVEGGYGFRLGARWRLAVFAAAGVELNVDTDGEDVGEGGIGLLGVSCAYGF